MSKTIVILQSNYFPWKGYFDLIAAADEFVIYDDVQFTKNDWRNRNLIKTPRGLEWLTVPVGASINRQIREVMLPNINWRISHLGKLKQNYLGSPFFKEIIQLVENVYSLPDVHLLSHLNRACIEAICDYLSIGSHISCSWDYDLPIGKTDRLVSLCKQLKGTTYLSGPAAKKYLDVNKFLSEGIEVEWFSYDDYKPYPQLWGGFFHEVTILDLLFNCGRASKSFMKCSCE